MAAGIMTLALARDGASAKDQKASPKATIAKP
eukprot:CAMPEP_0172503792 /NCGR_PEP_ID=MMETSP1066-20121228/172353_1 /TAXON_ID=671091 /ORGANISM="Coscinodiscus wailesii, Strain CCMP2513" /LENGTH=31 /DNA_ID= /DNA_START= /DNA_END= /DNA_ORIENTATION=